MILSDRLWRKIQPATAPFEGVDRKEVEIGLLKGDYQLFESGDSVAITSAFENVLRIGLAGGALDELVDVEKQIQRFAIKEGFTMIEIIGRPGWEKALEGYDKIAVILRKEVGYGLH